jgi:hypothetical protein
MTTYRGSCHCGDLTIEYETALEPGSWPLRECQCSFCRKHAMLSTSDPNGEVLLLVKNSASLKRYRFATGVTDFLLCARCGVYLGATVMNDAWIVLNGRAMECAGELVARAAEPRVYDQQSADERIARRIRMWSRCRIETRGDEA